MAISPYLFWPKGKSLRNDPGFPNCRIQLIPFAFSALQKCPGGNAEILLIFLF